MSNSEAKIKLMFLIIIQVLAEDRYIKYIYKANTLPKHSDVLFQKASVNNVNNGLSYLYKRQCQFVFLVILKIYSAPELIPSR